MLVRSETLAWGGSAAMLPVALRARRCDGAAAAARNFWWDVLARLIGGAASYGGSSIRSKLMAMRAAAAWDRWLGSLASARFGRGWWLDAFVMSGD